MFLLNSLNVTDGSSIAYMF